MNLQSVQKEVGPALTWRPWSAGTSTLYAAASGISAVRLAWFEIMASADYQGSGTQQFAQPLADHGLKSTFNSSTVPHRSGIPSR